MNPSSFNFHFFTLSFTKMSSIISNRSCEIQNSSSHMLEYISKLLFVITGGHMTLSVKFRAKCSMILPAVIYQIITCDPLFSLSSFLLDGEDSENLRKSKLLDERNLSTLMPYRLSPHQEYSHCIFT